VTETPVGFGPESALIGVLTKPAAGERSALAFLMFNAGVISRVGPHRINVKLARALASAGETAFRFDLSGRGDSRTSTFGAPSNSQDQAVIDIRHAMDHLQQTCGIHRFALIGICSGAVDAFSTAVVDSRVVGVLMFDGYWYRSRWTVPVRDWKRFRSMSWSDAAAAVRRRLARLLRPPTSGNLVSPAPAAQITSGNLPRNDFARSVNVLVARQVAVFLVYSGSVIDHYSYAGQFRDAFKREGFVGKVRCDFYPDIDHTLIALDAQRRFVDIVCRWVAQVPTETVGAT
jgi:pimeloyl-ACP methyl ester carboxylesterase